MGFIGRFIVKAAKSPFISLFKVAVHLKWWWLARSLYKLFGFIQPIAAEHVINAVKDNDITQLKFLTEAGFYYNSHNAPDRSILKHAALFCDNEILNILIMAHPGKRINSENYPDILHSLIRDSTKSTSNIKQTLKILINAGIDVNKTDGHKTPLEYALETEQETILTFLLENGATEPRQINFWYSKNERNKRSFNLLASKGFDIVVQNTNMALHAAQTKLLATYNAPTIDELSRLNRGDINSLSRSIYIIYAKLIKNINNNVEKLISKSLPGGIWTNILSYMWGDNPFYTKIKSKLEDGGDLLTKAIIMQDVQKIMDLVRLYPENINTKDAEGLTPLYCAHKVGSNQIAQILINNGAEISLAEETMNNDNTALNNKYNVLWVPKNDPRPGLFSGAW